MSTVPLRVLGVEVLDNWIAMLLTILIQNLFFLRGGIE